MSKTILRLSKKCALSNYSEDHRFETFDLSVETEVTETTEAVIKETFDHLRRQIFDQEHDTILFFLENSHEEKEEPNQNPNEDDNGELII